MVTRAAAVLRENAIQAKRARRRRRANVLAIRLRELNLLLTCRYGGEVLPDTPDTRRAIVIVANHLGNLSVNPRHSVIGWLGLRAPWYSLGDAEALILQVSTKPRRYKAQALAWQLKLTEADRATLRITTIGSVDLSTPARIKARAQRNRLAKMDARLSAGHKTRAEYIAQVSLGEPWKAEGISRRTWFRRRNKVSTAALDGTRPGTADSSIADDEPVPPEPFSPS